MKKQRRGEPRPGRLLSAFHYEVLDELELEAAVGDPLHRREVSVDGFSSCDMLLPLLAAIALGKGVIGTVASLAAVAGPHGWTVDAAKQVAMPSPGSSTALVRREGFEPPTARSVAWCSTSTGWS
jgi:hypothetical protein